MTASLGTASLTFRPGQVFIKVGEALLEFDPSSAREFGEALIATADKATDALFES